MNTQVISLSDAPAGPVVSIVVPAFNRLRFLRESIDSVFKQSFQDWELIVADDGSNDETKKFVASLTDTRIKVVELAHSGIPAVVRNAAIRVASGKYVAFLDSDDVWRSDKLDTQLRALRSQSQCKWSYSGFIRVDTDGHPLRGEDGRKWRAYSGEIFEQVAATAASIRTPAVIVERGLLVDVGAFDERLQAAEDYDLWMRLALQSEAIAVDQVLVQVRFHDENLSNKRLRGIVSRAQSLRKIEATAGKRWRRIIRRERARTATAIAAAYWRNHRYGDAIAELARSASFSWARPEWWWTIARQASRQIFHLRREPSAQHLR